eukprot:m.15896 g.15896  ORF g.15896 m.15896 type:complete len:432 (+) comp6785_c0_seq1:1119-2414(+)
MEVSQTLPYRLLSASGVCALCACILLWVRSDHVMEGSLATRAADYNTIGLFYVWAVAACSIFLRDGGLHAHTKICRMFLAGLVYNAINTNKTYDWATTNIYRIYTQYPYRLRTIPSSDDVIAARCMLAGAALGHVSVVFAIIAALLRPGTACNFSFFGSTYCAGAWIVALPGAICIWVSPFASFETIAGNTDAYFLCWSMTTTTLGILTLHSLGLLFDCIELVTASAVATGVHGLFLLGSLFSILSYVNREQEPTYSQIALLSGGGALCTGAVVISLIGIIVYFRDSGFTPVYMHERSEVVVVDAYTLQVTTSDGTGEPDRRTATTTTVTVKATDRWRHVGLAPRAGPGVPVDTPTTTTDAAAALILNASKPAAAAGPALPSSDDSVAPTAAAAAAAAPRVPSASSVPRQGSSGSGGWRGLRSSTVHPLDA